ncbi:unnamed protein product [Closterium sp. NIES-53]
MASLRVLTFDHEGRPVQFDMWLDDLQLYLLSDSKDSVSLFDLASGAATAPPATADIEDLVSHLRASDACYCAAAPTQFLDKNQPPMFITLYFIVTRLPDSLRSVKNLFLSLDPTSLTVDLLEQHLLATETSAVAVAGGTGGFAAASPGAGDPTVHGAAGARGSYAGGAGVGGAGAGGDGVGGTGGGGAGGAEAGAVDPGVGGAGGTVWPRPYFVPLLQQALESQPPDHWDKRGCEVAEELASRPVSPVRIARRVPPSRPPPVPGTHAMALCPSSVPLRVPLPAPSECSLPKDPDPDFDRARAASPTVSRLLASAVIDPSFESAAASALVGELLYFAAPCHLDYATALVAESASTSPPSIEEAITGPYSSQWEAAMDAEALTLVKSELQKRHTCTDLVLQRFGF